MAVDSEMETWRKTGGVRRLWAGDKACGPGPTKTNGSAGSGIVEEELGRFGKLERFAAKIKKHGFTDVVLLGMGGSSLGPEVLGRLSDTSRAGLAFTCWTAPIRPRSRRSSRPFDLGKRCSWFPANPAARWSPIFSSDYFFDRVAAVRGKDKTGEHFVAVTDPGSPLEQPRQGAAFCRHLLWRDLDRRTLFGAVEIRPGAGGSDGPRRQTPCLKPRSQMERRCGADVPPAENPGVQLGIAMGVPRRSSAATRSRSSLRRRLPISAPGWSSCWPKSPASTGEGLIPLADEPLATPSVYGSDRFFAYLELDGDADPMQRQDAVEALEKAGHPVARIAVNDNLHIGQEFFRWEIATAVAGAIIGINPFDQPDVEASKVKDAGAHRRLREVASAAGTDADVSTRTARALRRSAQRVELGRHNTLAGYLASHFGRVHAGDYVALLAYVERNAPHTRALHDDARPHSRPRSRRHLPRLRPAVPAFHRAGLQGRAQHRRVPADHLRRRSRLNVPGQRTPSAS